MSKLTKNGKLFGKINVLDFIIIAILLVMLAGVVYKFGFVDNSLYIPDFKEGTITVRAVSMSKNDKNALAVGDPFCVPNVQKLGKIVDIQYENTLENQKSTDGNVYTAANPLLYDAVITIECDEMSYRNDNYYVGKNYKVISGQSLDVSNGILNFKSTVVSVAISD